MVKSWLLAKYDAINPPALKRMTDAGAVIKPFPAPVMEACYRAANEYYAELAAKEPGFKRALDFVTPSARTSRSGGRSPTTHSTASITGARGRARVDCHFSPVKFFSSGVQQSA